MITAQRDAAVANNLLDRFRDARRKSDSLFAIVKPEAIYDRPIPERHRIVFYIGHLEAFDWNLLHENVFGLKSFHPDFDRLFAFGIDPVGGGLPTDQPSDWPSLQTVQEYVMNIRSALDEKLDEECPAIWARHARRFFAQHSSQCRHRTPLDACGNIGLHASPVASGTQDSPAKQSTPPESNVSPFDGPNTGR